MGLVNLVQSNAASGANGTSGAAPAWFTTPTLGNLLILCANSYQGVSIVNTALTGAGWTASAGSPFIYDLNDADSCGLWWKIAGSSEGTPPSLTDSGSPNWYIATFEFNATNGWVASAYDTGAHSAASTTAVTSRASGSTATLAQDDELAFAFNASAVTRSAFAWTGGFVASQATHGTASVLLETAWLETAATTALATTPTWTTATASESWIATFKPTLFAGPPRPILVASQSVKRASFF